MKVTIKEIAIKAGVSPAAVSKALNGKSDIGDVTRERIIRISEELGYRPNMIARNLVKRSNNTVGVLVPDISIPIYPAIYQGINDEAIVHGYTLLLGDTKRSIEQERTYAVTMMEQRVAGLLISPVSNDISHIEEVVRGQVPVVYFGGKVNDTMKNYVGVDNYRGGWMAATHLIDSGHSRITMVCDDLSTKTRTDRVHGYRDAMVKRGLEPDVLFTDQGLKGMECGIASVESLRAQGGNLPTALFALNDLIALGAMQALSEAGIKVPDEVCVMGYDDLSFVGLPIIDLSTIRQPTRETGEMAFCHLRHLMGGEVMEEGARRIVLQPALKVRGSTRRR